MLLAHRESGGPGRLSGMATMTMAEVIATLEELLPLHEPDLWASLQPGATDQQLQQLRESVGPFAVPSDWLELLRWRNGGPWGGPWWPVLDAGHLLGTPEAIEHYSWLCENTDEWQWHRSWLPIAHEGWNQCGIEAATDETGLIVDGSFPDPPMRLAPSLPAVLHATCATMEAGISSQPPASSAEQIESWATRRAAVVDAIYKEYGEWMRMSIHAHALLPELRKRLDTHPRISVLLLPTVTKLNREEHISIYWLDREKSDAIETTIRTRSYTGVPPDEAAESIVSGLLN
jgi:hypothetical protein